MNNILHISGINLESIADGTGVRTTIYISGCTHNCPECQSPQTHDFTYGTPVSDELIHRLNADMKSRSYLSGITLTGGDPMCSPKQVIQLIKALDIPYHNIWCYTGFTYEEIIQDKDRCDLLEYIDVLVDGPYVHAKRDITLQFRGSTNQRIIDVKNSHGTKIVLWHE